MPGVQSLAFAWDVADGINGNYTQSRAYDAVDRLTSMTSSARNESYQYDAVGSAAFSPPGFPGQYWDAEDNLWHNGSRDYDAKTGRYIQSDPIGLRGGVNTYVYDGGNPLTVIDPSATALEAHSTMSTQALGSEHVHNGLKDILLGPAQLYEALRAKSAATAIPANAQQNPPSFGH